MCHPHVILNYKADIYFRSAKSPDNGSYTQVLPIVGIFAERCICCLLIQNEFSVIERPQLTPPDCKFITPISEIIR